MLLLTGFLVVRRQIHLKVSLWVVKDFTSESDRALGAQELQLEENVRLLDQDTLGEFKEAQLNVTLILCGDDLLHLLLELDQLFVELVLLPSDLTLLVTYVATEVLSLLSSLKLCQLLQQHHVVELDPVGHLRELCALAKPTQFAAKFARVSVRATVDHLPLNSLSGLKCVFFASPISVLRVG